MKVYPWVVVTYRGRSARGKRFPSEEKARDFAIKQEALGHQVRIIFDQREVDRARKALARSKA